MARQQRETVCGFIGLGSLGGPMARRMSRAGYRMLVWDQRSDAAEAFADTAIEFVSGIAEIAARAEHVGICVVDDEGVADVCRQLFSAMPSGGRIAIHATISPAACRSLAAQASTHGLSLIDAPITGVGGAAEAGQLAVMVGGEAAAVEAARPILETFGALVVHLGDVGAGQVAKLVHNGLSAASFSLAHSVLSLGETLGIDRALLAQIVALGTGRSYAVELLSTLSQPGDFRHGAQMLRKDILLLEDVTQGNADAEALRRIAMPYLELAIQDAQASGCASGC